MDIFIFCGVQMNVELKTMFLQRWQIMKGKYQYAMQDALNVLIETQFKH